MKYLLISILLVGISSCYTRNKAQKSFARAAVTYPEIAAEYCARTYPPKDSLIKGDTVLTLDTIYTGGDIVFDTVRIGDTIRIVKTIQLPGTKIIERYFVHDTLQITNTAAVDLWQIEARKAISIATDKTKEADKWRKIAKKRFWVILGLGAAMALGIFAMVRRKLVKKVVP